MYLNGDYVPPSFEEYVDSAIYVLTHISPEMIVHRITGDCPKGLLVAPSWNQDKNKIINEIQTKMKDKNLKQGCFYEKGCFNGKCDAL